MQWRCLLGSWNFRVRELHVKLLDSMKILNMWGQYLWRKRVQYILSKHHLSAFWQKMKGGTILLSGFSSRRKSTAKILWGSLLQIKRCVLLISPNFQAEGIKTVWVIINSKVNKTIYNKSLTLSLHLSSFCFSLSPSSAEGRSQSCSDARHKTLVCIWLNLGSRYLVKR